MEKDDDAGMAGIVPRFEFWGADADWPHCDLCGRDGLEKTFVLRDLDSGEVFHYGGGCVKTATAWTVARWTQYAYAAALDAAVREYRDCPERRRMLELADEGRRCRNAQRNANYARAEIAARHRVKSRDILPRLKQMRAENNA